MGFAAIYFLISLCLNIFTHSFCDRIPKSTCIESERQALLQFKHDLKDSSNRLAAWNSTGDCCHWAEVVCDNVTGHVTELHLGSSQLASMAKTKAAVRSKLGGKLNPSLLDLKYLSYLDLSENDFDQTQIPSWFWNLTYHLQYLDISGNHFQGNIPDLLTTSCASVVLNFSSNKFTGPLPRISFNVTALDLSNNAMSGSISLWNMTSHLQYLNISRNHFQGNISDLLATSHASVVLDFSFNKFTGPLPRVSFNVTALDLSNNPMSGSISQFLCHRMSQPMKLEVLNPSDNLFSGEIPDCWENWPSLVAVKLCNNNFSGNIPSSMGTLASLQSLHLRNNNLGGEVPPSLGNCTELLTIDFGGNQLTGEIPPWMGKKLSKLIIMSLQANKFHGHIPEKFCNLSSLQILDISHNNFSGNIPSCIGNLSAMVSNSRNISDGKISYNTSRGCFFDNIELVMKGAALDYGTTLKLIAMVDLSDNKLSGKILEEVTSLKALQSLNLSNNLLDGRIPKNIGAMRLLECVDFSENNLSGEIPISMSQLSFLSYLNLSNNKLSGKIPTSTQLQSFPPDSFGGTDFYGQPLTPSTHPAPTPTKSLRQYVETPTVDRFHLFVGFGFLFGLLGVAGLIIITRLVPARCCGT